MKRNLLFIIGVFFYTLSFGQGEIDAYRYSSSDLSGTARGQAMGGAFGALGGDITGVAINPAGIGVYRSSEVVANLSVASPVLKGITNQESNTKVGFDNFAYIGYYPMVKGSMLSLNFGFNYNRTKSFNQRFGADQSNISSSLTDYMVTLTNGVHNSDFAYTDNNNPYSKDYIYWLSILAWESGLINLQPNSNDTYESILNEGEKVNPSLKVWEKGEIESYDFTIGSNVADKFYWGFTFALTDLSYTTESSYNETFQGGSGFQLDNYLRTEGSGYQAKFGVIYKPTSALRIGVAYHSPVWYTMTDYYQAALTPEGIDLNGIPIRKKTTPDNAVYNYQLRTPGSWTFSAAAVIGTKAIVSVDYETKDYSAMNMQDENGYAKSYENNLIKKDYKTASMLRAGLEFRLTPQFSGRLGYALAQNPYRSSIQSLGETVVTSGTIPHYTLSNDVTYLTGGLGFRFTPQFYGDIALVYRMQEDQLSYFPPVENREYSYLTFTNKALKGLLTLGYKF